MSSKEKRYIPGAGNRGYIHAEFVLDIPKAVA